MDRWKLALVAVCATFVIFFAPTNPATFAGEGTSGLSPEQHRQEVLDTYPGVRLLHGGGWIQFYGHPMNVADTPEQAVEEWLALHAEALGAPTEEFELLRDVDVHWGRFVCFHYRQSIQGIPVHGTAGRILALEPSQEDDSRPGWSIVMATSSEFVNSPDNLPTTGWKAEEAVDSVRATLDYGDMELWGNPMLAMIRDDAGNVRKTWNFSGAAADKAKARAFEFYVDVRDGALVKAESAVFHDDIDGTVTAMATPGTNPDYSGNTPEELAMPGIWIDGPGSDNAYADVDGYYVLEDLPDSSQSLDVTLWGEWVDVDTDQGSEPELDDSGTPPATLDFLFNEDEDEYDLAQVNAFIHTQKTHDFIDEYTTSLGAIDVRLKANTNLLSSCNAYFTSFGGGSINFYHAAGGCVNTAYSSVVAHEYGHFIVWKLSLAQGAFGEGFSDAVSIMQYDDYQVGRRFFGGSLPIRNPKTADRQYPCVGGVHYCGETVGGSWSEILDNFKDTIGDEDGLEDARQLFVDWTVITDGGIFNGTNYGAHPGTAIEVLTVDDTDGVINNGTPNYADICDAFDQHNIDCPEIDALLFEYPDGRPEFIDTDGSTTFVVRIIDVGEIADGATAEVHYSVNDGSFSSESLTDLGGGEFEIEIPVSDCADIIDYYVTVEDTGGTEHIDPLDAPTDTYETQVADELIIEFDDDFSADEGWVVDPDSDDTADEGIWERVVPVGNSSAPNEDITPGDTDGMCFVTGVTTSGGSQSSNDVDGGRTTLLSPVIDMSATTGAYTVSFYRWFCNNRGADATGDLWRVDIRNSEVSPWINVELISEPHPRGWVYIEFAVTDYVVPTTTVELRFVAEDNDDPSVVEAAIDDFRVDLLECEGYIPDDPPSGSGTFQRGDVTGEGDINFNDIFEFLNVVFLGEDPGFDCEEAFDMDNNGTTSVSDVIHMLEYQLLGNEAPAAPFFACGFDFDVDSLTCVESSSECE